MHGGIIKDCSSTAARVLASKKAYSMSYDTLISVLYFSGSLMWKTLFMLVLNGFYEAIATSI